MKLFLTATVLAIFITLPGLSQVSDTTAVSQQEGPVSLDPEILSDTLSEILPDTLSEILPDTLQKTLIDPQWDTSYFFTDDPEYNLIMAAERGKLGHVKMLVDREVSVNVSTYEGVTPLMYASDAGDLAMVDFLVEQDARLDTRPDNGISALIGATRADRYEVVKYLLDAGAEVDLQDYTELTALMHASAYNYTRIVTLLAQGGANLETKDWFGTTPLMTAVYYNCYESARELVRLGADVNAQDTFGFTPLMIAAQHGDYDLAWMLLDNGADLGIQNKGGQHAISMAVLNDETDIIELLVESGANLNQNISSSTNALNMAREMENDEMVNHLKGMGARKNLAPEISGLRFGSSLNFNRDDFNVIFEAGVSEAKYKSFATTGFLFRPAPVRILRTENDTLSYQYWEKRYAWPVSLGKQFSFEYMDNKQFGVRFQLTGALTWGAYRGSDRHPRVRYLFIPSAGMFWRERFYGLTLDYEHVPLKVYDISHHRIRLGVHFFIDLRKRTRFTQKHIEWF